MCTDGRVHSILIIAFPLFFIIIVGIVCQVSNAKYMVKLHKKQQEELELARKE